MIRLDKQDQIELDEYTAMCFAVIGIHGFTSEKKANESGGIPTWVRAQTKVDGKFIFEPFDDDWENADCAFEFYLDTNRSDRNNYYAKVEKLASQQYVETYTDMKIAASVAGWNVAYDARIQAQVKLQKAGKQSKHWGNTGDTFEGELLVTAIHHTHGQWGATKITTMSDAKGNVFVWFNTGQAILELNRRYKLKGRVRAHREYKGVKQTIISRCRVQK